MAKRKRKKPAPRQSEPRHICAECGKRRVCGLSLVGRSRVWTCWPCLDAEEDGYAVQLI